MHNGIMHDIVTVCAAWHTRIVIAHYRKIGSGLVHKSAIVSELTIDWTVPNFLEIMFMKVAHGKPTSLAAGDDPAIRHNPGEKPTDVAGNSI